jgi:SAM-dependent methyltransferase
MPIVDRWCSSVSCCDVVWEAAYQQFETAEEEVRKFRKRLLAFGALQWPQDSRILELFCGRGNGLRALASLGFTCLSGVDLSETLLKGYDGPADLYVGDCRDLKISDGSIDIVIVQGGLHHLPSLLNDLERTLAEVRRVLRPNGRFVVVEPWNGPFLRLVHALCSVSLVRRSWKKLDALSTMIERERASYESWLSRGEDIQRLLRSHFLTERESMGWGKLSYLGRCPSG